MRNTLIASILGLILFIAVPTTAFASTSGEYLTDSIDLDNGYDTDILTTNKDTEELKHLLKTVESYIDLEGSGLFDEERAMSNNESQEVMEIGAIYNDMLRAEEQGDYEKINRRKRAIIKGITHYGNWCGKGNNGEPPIDILDAQCEKHDRCYAANGMWNSECDLQLVHNIAKNFGAINEIGGHTRNYAVAAMSPFAWKAGGIAVLKAQYPILGPFLP